MNHSSLIKSLTYLGAAPFFLAVALKVTGNTFLGVEAHQWFLSYGLLILSFMAGTLWGQALNDDKRVKAIAITSNAITLLAWFAFLLGALSVAIVVLALGFIALYALEATLMQRLNKPRYYLALRRNVTALVVVAHGIMFFLV
ncbi:DUF3429 domain-containing protein [Leucothrix sargassi]|nr:DUF3429 domain-containing protein [Leucothrix sargassi]